MSLKRVKEDARIDLYEGHEIKKELVVGPVVLQQSDLTYKLNDKIQPTNMKEHIAVRNSDSAIFTPPASVKQEPPWDENCMVKIPTQVDVVTQKTDRAISMVCVKEEQPWDENCMVKIPTLVDEVMTGPTNSNTDSVISKACVKEEPPWHKNCMVKIPTQVNEVTEKTDSQTDIDTFTARDKKCMEEVSQEADSGIGHVPLIGMTLGASKNLDNCIDKMPSHMDEVVKRELLKEDSDCEINGIVQQESKGITRPATQTEDDGVASTDDKLLRTLRSRFVKIHKTTPSRLRIRFDTDSDSETDTERKLKRKKQKTSDGHVNRSLNRNKQKKTNVNDSKKDILKGKKPKKIHECNYCGKQFSFRPGLTNHIRTHTGEKPYSCKICSKSFSDCAVLVRHRRMHSGEKPHACDICGKKYSEKYLLKNHKLTHTGEMQYFCKFCPKQFVNSSNYRRHQQTHMHQYICDLCKKHFATKDRLVSHISNHLKPRPFVCKFCNKSFNQNGHMNRHLVIHTGPKQVYDCGVCKKVFSQKTSLDKHTKRKVCEKKK